VQFGDRPSWRKCHTTGGGEARGERGREGKERLHTEDPHVKRSGEVRLRSDTFLPVQQMHRCSRGVRRVMTEGW